MILMPQTMIALLVSGGGVRISARSMLPQTMVDYAAAANRGGGRLEIVIGDTALVPETLTQVVAAGGGTVLFDFVSPDPEPARRF